jgi:hypothetical protein
MQAFLAFAVLPVVDHVGLNFGFSCLAGDISTAPRNKC